VLAALNGNPHIDTQTVIELLRNAHPTVVKIVYVHSDRSGA
jgi:hypothetical protein